MDNENPMESHPGIAVQNSLSGFNCAQAVFCAFEDVHGLEPTYAYCLSSSFGGGLGWLRETCGALSGALMVLGLLEGSYPPGDAEAKAEHYRKIQKLAAEFEEEIGAKKCWQILGLPEGPTEPVPVYHKPGQGPRPVCLHCVRYAAELIDRRLREKGMLE